MATKKIPKKVPKEGTPLPAIQKAVAIVHKIEQDINRRSGLSPMLWNDRRERDKILMAWLDIVKGELNDDSRTDEPQGKSRKR